MSEQALTMARTIAAAVVNGSVNDDVRHLAASLLATLDAGTTAWRAVVGFEGLYEVSSSGQIRSISREIVDALGQSRPFIGRTLVPSLRNGYRFVTLRKDGRSHYAAVHRSVCTAFHGPAPADQPLCRHLDDDRENNSSDNLAWGTPQSNADDARSLGRFGKAEGQPSRPMQAETRAEILTLRAEGMQVREISERLGVAKGRVHNVIGRATRRTTGA